MDFQSVIRDYPPSPALQDCVLHYTVVYSAFHEIMVRCQPAFPQQNLIFYPYSPQKYSTNGSQFMQLPQVLLKGPFTEPVFLRFNPFQLMIIVNFLPGALHRLTHLPLHEIVNQPLEGELGFGSEIKKLNEQLSEAKAPEHMIRLIESFLLKKHQNVKALLPIEKSFNLLVASPAQYNIEQVASLSCVSLRQLERQFLNRLGTTPTMFIRQARFAKAFRLKRRNPELSWTAVAYECGYFDQMHLIRDFKLFTASTPTSFNIFIPASVFANT